MESLSSQLPEIGSFLPLALGAIAIFTLYIMRNRVLALISLLGGYTVLDDYRIALLKNNVLYQKNKLAILQKVSDTTNLVLIASMFLSNLFSSYLFLITAALFLVYNISKAQQLESYNMFEKTDDEFIDFFDYNHQKIDSIVATIILTAQIIIFFGVTTHLSFLVNIGVMLSVLVFGAAALSLVNALAYKSNYKPIEYYRLMRLLNSTAILNNKGLIPYVLLSIYCYVEFPEGEVAMFAITAIKILITIMAKKAMTTTDNMNQTHKSVENRNYDEIEKVASYPNPKSQSRGYKFSTALQMKFFELEQKGKGGRLVHFDNYAFFPNMVNRSILRLNPLLLKQIKDNVKIYFNALFFTQQFLLLGGMRSGKTASINYIVQQVVDSKFTIFQSIIFNDKKGDFCEKFYRPEKDHIINLFDKRASVWDIFEEMQFNIEAGANFINNLYEEIAGGEKDFFSGRAKQITNIWLKEAFFKGKNSVERWELFFGKMAEMEAEIEAKDDKTKSSLLQTIQIVTDILEIMRYQIVTEKRRTFTLTEWINETDTQLFILNTKQYEATLSPYLSGIWGAYAACLMAKADTEEHLILNIFDEFLTLKLDDTTRDTFLTATRSKGACNILAAQFLPEEDKSLLQAIDNSKYGLIVFNINDGFTVDTVLSKLASAEILTASLNAAETNQGGASVGDDSNGGAETLAASLVGGMFANKPKASYSLSETSVLYKQQLQSMPRYHHLTFIPSEMLKVFDNENEKNIFKAFVFGFEDSLKSIVKSDEFLAKEAGILYLGQSPLVNIETTQSNFEAWDMRSFFEKKINNSNGVVACTYTEEEKFVHWYNLKFAGSIEEAKEYMVAHKLVNVCLKEIFEGIEENDVKVELFKSKTTEEQRLNYMNEFFDCESILQKYKFCKDNDLVGCILGIFNFSDEFISSKLEKENV